MPAAGRLGDKATILACAHGCVACPHPGTGPGVSGSSNVLINGLPALREGDSGIHAACCQRNSWNAVGGCSTVFINGKPAHRQGDATLHCGGVGKLVGGSPSVFIGGGVARAKTPASGASVRDAQMTGGTSRPGAPLETQPERVTPALDSVLVATGLDEAVDKDTLVIQVVTRKNAPVSFCEIDVVLPSGEKRLKLTDSEGKVVFQGLPPGIAHVVLPDFEELAVREVPPRVSGATPYRTGGVDAEVGRKKVIEVPPKTIRARLLGLLFETDKTFLLPKAVPGVRMLKRFYDQDPAEMLIVGHTDTQGMQSYNEALSRDRAEAVLHYLTDDVAGWMKWYEAGLFSKRFGTREDQWMLSTVKNAGGNVFYNGPIDGTKSVLTRDAITEFQAENGLSVTGIADVATRQKLVAAYMALDGTTLSVETVELHGCGETHPIAITADNVSEQQNRRVEVFLFQDGISPSPQAKEPAAGCAEYEKWLAQTTLTVDLDLPPGQLTATVTDDALNVLADVLVHLSGPLPDVHNTDASGQVRFADLVPGRYRITAQKAGFETLAQEIVIASEEDLRLGLMLKSDRHDLRVHVTNGVGDPIASCDVTLQGAVAKSALTDPAGTAKFSDLPSGVYKITAQKSGFDVGVADAVVPAKAPPVFQPGQNARLVEAPQADGGAATQVDLKLLPKAPTLTAKIGVAPASGGGAPVMDTAAVVQLGDKVRIEWQITGAHDGLVLRPGDVDLLPQTKNGQGEVEFFPLDHLPDGDGKYQIVAKNGGTSSPPEVLELVGLVLFEVRIDKSLPPVAGGDSLFLPDGVTEVENVLGLRKKLSDLPHDPSGLPLDGPFVGQVTPHANVVYRFVVAGANALRTELTVTGLTLDPQTKKTVPLEVTSESRASSPTEIPISDKKSHPSVTFLEAGLQVFRASSGQKGPPLASAALRLRENRKLPKLESFDVTDAGKVAAPGSLLKDWSKLGFRWKLSGDHFQNTLRVKITDQNGFQVVQELKAAGASDNQGAAAVTTKPMKGPLMFEAELSPAKQSLVRAFVVNPFVSVPSDKEVELEIRLEDAAGAPFANHDVTVLWASATLAAKTNGQGIVSLKVPAGNTKGTLTLHGVFQSSDAASADLTLLLVLEKFAGNPGVAARLHNLGYENISPLASPANIAPADLGHAIGGFQLANHLSVEREPSGVADEAFTKRLEDAHDQSGPLTK